LGKPGACIAATLGGTCPVRFEIAAIRDVVLGTEFGLYNASGDAFAGVLKQALQVRAPILETWAARLFRGPRLGLDSVTGPLWAGLT
jgi:hypothetical protein